MENGGLGKYVMKTSLKEKCVAITGATGGLGKELCRLLLESQARLIVIDRNKEKQHALIEELKKEFPESIISGMIADMESFCSVKALEKELCEEEVDYLILNAGAYSIPRRVSDIGFDNVFQINLVSPYYLTKKLLPSIRARQGKVIAVGSIAHSYSKTDKNDIDFKTRDKSSLVYGNSKRYLMGAFFALAKKGEPVVVAHPGISFTGITNHYPKLIFALIKNPMKIIFEKPRRACLSIFHAIFRTPPENSWIGPMLFGIWGRPKVSRVKDIKEDEEKFIFETCESIFLSICDK